MRRRLLLGTCVAALVLTGAAAASTPLPGIRSPSGNISCLLLQGGPTLLVCSIAKASYSGTLQARCMRPNGSGVDWHGFALRSTGVGALNCSGGILYSPAKYRPAYTTLPYGKSWHHGAFTCRSRPAGVTCTTSSGHGLFLSRASWRAW
jgi:hypothetical protein